MGLAEEMLEDFGSIHDDLPARVVVGGQELDALVSECEHAESLELGGFLPSRSISIKLPKHALEKRPKPGDVVSCEDVAYRVSSVQARSAVPFINLECQQI